MDDKKYCVYMHKNKINGKVYIGITCQKPENRWRNGNGYKNTIFANAIKKYGWENFEHIVFYDGLNILDAREKEKELIKKYSSKNINFGYNMTDGGEATSGFNHSNESIQKMRIAKLKKSSSRKSVICEGMNFNSIIDCANYYNVSPYNMGNWLNGRTRCPKIFIEMNLMFYESEKDLKKYKVPSNFKRVICDGIIFETISDCSKYYNIPTTTMNNWIKGIHRMPNDFYDMGLHLLECDNEIIKEKNIICDNLKFKTIRDCAKYFGVSEKMISTWVNHTAPIPKKFYDMNLHREGESVNPKIQKGREYKTPKNSIKIYCNELNISFNSMSECIKYMDKNLSIKIKHSVLKDVLDNNYKNYKGYTFNTIK